MGKNDSILVGILLLVVVAMAIANPTGTRSVADPIMCPTGQTSTLIYDKNVCGTELQKTNTGTGGACVVYKCEPKISIDDVAYCNVGIIPYGWTGSAPTNMIKLSAGQSYSFDAECAAERKSSGQFSLYYEVYRQRVNGCYTCVANKKPNECVLGTLSCGTGADQRTCVPATSDLPYNHWQTTSQCSAGKCQASSSYEGLKCVVSCQSDNNCARNQFCDSGFMCASKKIDGISCESNSQCYSNLCEKDILGSGACKTPAKGTGNVIVDDVVCTNKYSILSKDTCLACGGRWQSGGIVGDISTTIFGGQSEVSCDLPSISRSLGDFGEGFNNFVNGIGGQIIIALFVILAIVFVAKVRV